MPTEPTTCCREVSPAIRYHLSQLRDGPADGDGAGISPLFLALQAEVAELRARLVRLEAAEERRTGDGR